MDEFDSGLEGCWDIFPDSTSSSTPSKKTGSKSGSKSKKKTTLVQQKSIIVSNDSTSIKQKSMVSKKSSLLMSKLNAVKPKPTQSNHGVVKESYVDTESLVIESNLPDETTLFELDNFDLSDTTIEALCDRNILSLFPIQAKTFWPIRQGNDLIGRARTGQGKTLAFCLPILEQLLSGDIHDTFNKSTPKVLIMSPTRELAKQIVSEFEIVSKNVGIRIQAMYGGVSLNDNYVALKKGIDVIVGTPGRVKDLLDRQWLDLSSVRHVVLDEADQMLDMGFTDEIQFIFDSIKINSDDNNTSSNETDIPQTVRNIQVLMFSATMPQWAHKIADKYMKKERVVIDLVTGIVASSVTTIRHIAVPGLWSVLGSVINDVIAMYAGRSGRVLVFSSTKVSNIQYE